MIGGLGVQISGLSSTESVNKKGITHCLYFLLGFRVIGDFWDPREKE